MERSSARETVLSIGRSAIVAILGAVVLGLASEFGRAIARKIGADAWRRRYEEPP